MKFIVEYNPDFYNDIAQAVDWYNGEQAGLGDRLLKTIKQQTAKLSISALQYAIRYDDIRCLHVDKFPYLVHFRVNEQSKTVRVEALLHTSRNLKVWEERT